MTFAKRWCFTLNNYTDEDINRVKETFNHESCVFAVIGLEVAQSGTEHMQGFVHFRNRRTFKSLKSILPGAHIEIARGTDVENQNYCKKENNILLEIGQPAVSTQTHHSLLDAYELVKLVVSGEDLCDVIDDCDRYKVAYAKHQRFVDSLITKKTSRVLDIGFKRFYSKLNIVFRKWQAKLYEELLKDPHPRNIIWYIDAVGGGGKSTFAAIFITRESSVARYGTVKAADMALAYRGERVVFLDLARTNYDWMSLCALMEELKNGEIFSGKYESHTKRFQPPHVVVFANFPPPPMGFSEDRLRVRII